MLRYRLKSPIVGIQHAATGMVITQIATGEILTIPEVEKESGLVEVVHGGRNVSVFIQDLRESSEHAEIEPVVIMPSRSSKREAC